MGSVLYLHRGLQREAASPTAEAQRPESILRPGHNAFAVARTERLSLLVDAEVYFRAFYRAALRAKRSITILGWDFNSQTRLHFEPVPDGGPPALLGDFLNYLVRRKRGLHINVLNWDYPMVFGADREFPPLYGFGWRPSRRVRLRYDDTHPVAGSQHQKIVLIDDALAFVGGIDLTVRRWDSSEHAPDDPRRVAYGTPYPPFHDLMVALDGEAAQALARVARERWSLATGRALKAVSVDHDPWPPALEADLRGVEVGIARTMPPRDDAPAVREVEHLYLDQIASARREIYIENQYFTSPLIAAALEKRLAEADGPEIVLVLRLLSHGWLEEATMHVLRTRLIQRLKKADRHGRLHVYYPHIPGLPETSCLDVHSKMMVIDDRQLRVGSANLCKRSMGMDTECDVLVESRDEAEVAAVIRGLRDRLIAEHLGVAPARFRETHDRTGSLHGAIAELSGDGRTLRELDETREWPEALVSIVSVADPGEPIALDFLSTDRVSASNRENGRPAWGRLAFFAVVIAALAALWRYTPLAEIASAEHVIDWAKAFGATWWAPIVVVLSYTPACFVMFPRPLITLASVIAFGPWLGFLYSLIGIVFAASVTFFAGKRMRRDTVRRLAGPKIERMVGVLRKHGLLAMSLLRLVPLAPFFVVGVVAGAVRLKLWHLAAGTAVGMLPGTLAATVFGDQLERALSGGRINWWIVVACAALLAGGAYLVKRWFARMARRMNRDDPAAG